MPHKADESFFAEKRPWSRRKDRLLGSYVTAYLPKIATQGRPILVVDGFAGPGKFGDGEPGSPLILAQIIRDAVSRGLPVPVRLMCIEPVPELHEQLRQLMHQFSFVQPKHGEFVEFAGEIADAAAKSSVFLYVDPFTVEGLVWTDLDQIAAQLRQSHASVEMLVNFNASSFARRGLAALAKHEEVLAPEDEEEGPDSIDAPIDSPPSIEHLSEIVGTHQWQDVLRGAGSFLEAVTGVHDLFVAGLRCHFAEVCSHAVIAAPTQHVPKYYLVFATRHADGLELMNEEVVKSRRSLASLAEPQVPTLFEMRSKELVPATEEIPAILRSMAQERRPRKQWIHDVMRSRFGEYSKPEIRGTIEQLLKAGTMASATGKPRINDSVSIWFVSTRGTV